jgi:long-chain fatty acid transport protein
MKLTPVFAFMALAGLATGAQATNGYFAHGYGMKAKGMAGASTASSDDAFGGANNPASMAFAGNRLDLGADLFSPKRKASNSNFGGSGMAVSSESNSDYFVIPEFGYNKMLNPNMSLGVTVYGNGGMNTNYPSLGPSFGNANLLGGQGSLGVDLIQLIIAPTVAFKVAPNHSIGISPLLGYQRFRAEGLQAFGVNNPGYDDSTGYGVRVGYMGKITPTVTIGAAYASKMNFQKFDKYKGLFAEQGDFDIPENYNLGVAWQATTQLKLALDYQRINYSDVNAVGNPTSNLFAGQAFGASNGPGFGWDNIDIWKLGAEYKHNKQWTFRAGYSHTDSPIKGGPCSATNSGANCAEVTINILAPAVVEDHVTLGFTYTLASGNEVTMSYMHAFENSVSGVRPNAFGGGTDTIKMYQNSLGIQYSWKM